MIKKIKKTKKKVYKYFSNSLQKKREEILSDDFLEVIDKLKKI